MASTPLLLYTRPGTRELMRRRWRLVVVDGDDRGVTADLEETPALIGAAPAAVLVLTDDTVSRYHAEADVFADGIRIRDLDSTNGTFLTGDDRVREGFVENGSTFRVGRTLVRALAVDEPASSEIPTDPNLRVPGAVAELVGAIAVTPSMQALFEDVRRVAASSSSVLFRGERGSGKATLARALQGLSARARAPFFTVNAAELSRDDFHRLALRAHRGSLLIEDVDRLHPEVQVSLRSTTEHGEVRPNQDDKPLRVDVRLLTTSRTDLSRRTDFDPILLRRIAVVELAVPPLRERIEDAVELTNRRLAPLGLQVGPSTTAALASHPWYDNLDGLEAALHDPLAPGLLECALLEDAIAATEGDVSLLAEKLKRSTRSMFEQLAHNSVDLEACMSQRGPATDR